MSLQPITTNINSPCKIPTTLNVSPVKVPNGAKHIGNYILGKTIGSGSCGKVHLGLNIQTGQKVAIKIIEKQKLNGKDLQRLKREIEILKTICHPSIIHLYEIIQTQKSLLLVTQYMSNGQLFHYIINSKKIPETQACKIFHEIIDSLEYLHNIGIAHRDVKPENLMIDFDKKVKLIDFGLANHYTSDQGLQTQCGSPCYAAPQMISGKSKYNPLKTDIWSCGVTLFAMIAGYLPFCQKQTQVLFKKITSGKFTFPNWITDSAKDLILKMLTVNPSKRISFEQIKEHQWFKQRDFSKKVGIDTRIYKMPFEQIIIQHMKNQKLGGKNIQDKINSYQKCKQTALYYLIAKKYEREGFTIRSYYASKNFDDKLLKPKDLQLCVQAEIISPITDTESMAPKPNQFQSFHLKSPSFKPVLQQFLTFGNNSQKQYKIISAKQIFYCFNSDIWNKRTKLTAMTNKQKAKKLFDRHRSNNNKTLLLRPFHQQNKKNTLQLLQTLNTQNKSHKKKRNFSMKDNQKNRRLYQTLHEDRKLPPIKI